MLELNNIELPDNVTKSLSDNEMSSMIKMTYRMERPLLSALGESWKDILNEKKLEKI